MINILKHHILMQNQNTVLLNSGTFNVCIMISIKCNKCMYLCMINLGNSLDYYQWQYGYTHFMGIGTKLTEATGCNCVSIYHCFY